MILEPCVPNCSNQTLSEQYKCIIIKTNLLIAGIEYNVQVAGSVGPFGAFLHDGSEYTGIYCDKYSEQALIDWHRPRIEALIEGGVDILALETLPCTKEALALLRLLKEYPSTKAWISFSIKVCTSFSNSFTKIRQ